MLQWLRQNCCFVWETRLLLRVMSWSLLWLDFTAVPVGVGRNGSGGSFNSKERTERNLLCKGIFKKKKSINCSVSWLYIIATSFHLRSDSFFSLKQADLWQLWRSAGSKGDLQPYQHLLLPSHSSCIRQAHGSYRRRGWWWWNSQRRGCREALPMAHTLWRRRVGCLPASGHKKTLGSLGRGQVEAHPAAAGRGAWWSSSQAPAAERPGECHCCSVFILNIMIHYSTWENFVSGKHDIRVQLGE